jgi:hypothetical protein
VGAGITPLGVEFGTQTVVPVGNTLAQFRAGFRADMTINAELNRLAIDWQVSDALDV